MRFDMHMHSNILELVNIALIKSLTVSNGLSICLSKRSG